MKNEQIEAMNLLRYIIEKQPGLLSGHKPYAATGTEVGEFINALYDQLVELTTRNAAS